MKKQPAEKSYVFDQVYRDMENDFKKMWGEMFDKASKEIRKWHSNNVCLRALKLVFLLIIIIVCIIVNLIISLWRIIPFLTVVPIVYISFVFVAFLDLVYRRMKHISSVCPNPYCQDRFDLPIYLCPSCGSEHSRLIPSKYGIFKRKCLCGEKLSTTFFNGRQKLKAVCPNCGFHLPHKGDCVNICIPVIGGNSAGKTCFINMAIFQIEQGVTNKKEYDFEYVSDGLKLYENIQKIETNRRLDSTEEDRLQYYQFYLTSKREKTKRLVSICDIKGEVYSTSTREHRIDSQLGFRNANAFLIVVDPLSIAGYKSEVRKAIDLKVYGASGVSIDEILSRLVNALGNRVTLKTDVAIVFTKCDLPGLEEEIGQKAVNEYVQNHRVTKEEASNIVCEAFLRKYQEDNFVNNAKSKFKSIQYFTCSSLGDINNTSVQPERVEEPILWLLKKYITI